MWSYAKWFKKASWDLDDITHTTMINASEESGDKHLNSSSTATSSFEKWELALSLLEDMSLNQVKPDGLTLASVVRALITASSFQAGFTLLDDIENGKYGYLKHESIDVYRILQSSLRDQGVVDVPLDPHSSKTGLQLAYDVEKRMLGLEASVAVATANTEAHTYVPGFERRLNSEMNNLFKKIRER